MDQQARIGATRRHLVDDLVERHLTEPKVADGQAQDEEGRRHPAGHGDLDLAELVGRERTARDHDRPVARAHARAVREQDVAVLDERVRVDGDRGRLEPALERPLVQRLDVGEDVLELEAAWVDPARRQRPEHEGVVGIRAVAEADEHERRRLAHAPSRCG